MRKNSDELVQFWSQRNNRVDPEVLKSMGNEAYKLGKAEKALNCNETSPCVDSILAFQAQALQNHLSRCTKARKVKDWKVILKESQATISLGVDSAPLDAVTTSQQASKLDPSSSEVNAVVRRARAVASAKMSGNLLFKASKFTEAYVVYNEGL
ncbi:hypothetical protein JHK82_039159 [Glycine max]|nr:hypothetical protein JHK86_039338 [Glycine max]KAG4964944.1 hypothetical protein JHK85_039919 [Glycine max]KAG5109936.1 hypothetical protein JHK82_039159 [Glycine max]